MTASAESATIRAMRWWDIQPVHAIELQAFPTTAWPIEMFWSEIAAGPETRWYIVAEGAKQILGYAGLMTVGADADVQTIAVSPDSQRRGLGRRLLVALVDEARRRGVSRIFLEVGADNAAARNLYECNGFEATAQRPNYYAPGQDAVLMRRVLEETVTE